MRIYKLRSRIEDASVRKDTTPLISGKNKRVTFSFIIFQMTLAISSPRKEGQKERMKYFTRGVVWFQKLNLKKEGRFRV